MKSVAAVFLLTATANAIYDPRCYQPLDPGPCRGLKMRFAYDPSQGRCVRFAYGGCLGNENNFKTNRECMLACSVKRSLDQDPEDRGTGTIPMDSFKRYLENIAMKTAPKDSMDLSPEESKIKITPRNYPYPENNRIIIIPIDPINPYPRNSGIKIVPYQPRPLPETDSTRCTQSIEPGPCRGYIRRYGFDTSTGKCVPFIYGGCEGNSNRFDTKAECQLACLAYTPMPI